MTTTPTPTDDTEVVEDPDADEAEEKPRSTPWDPKLPQRLAVGAGALVAVVVLLAVALPRLSGDGDSASDREDAAETPEPRPSGGEAGDPAAGDAPAVGLDDVAGAPPADLLALGPAVPAKPGSYDLKVTIDDRVVNGSYTVSGDGASQVHRTDLDGSVSQQELSWQDGALRLVATTDPAAGTCRWAPAPLLVPADVALGKSWSTESDCTVEREGAALAVHQSSSAEVVERGQTTVGGRAVEVWVVQRHETQTRGMGEASVVSDVLSSELVAPQLGLVVERLTRADVVRSDGSTQTVTIVERLQGLP